MLQEQLQKRKEREEMEDAYQYMSSAGQGVSRTQFTYHPYTTDRSTAMRMNQGEDPGLTFPCPAAAGSTSSPVHDHHTEQELHFHMGNAAFIDDPLPNVAEEEQEYTAMSRAGTLTGQNIAAGPYSPSAHTSNTAGQMGNMEYPVELHGNVTDQGGHSVMVTEC